jgi:hypothetical protein
VCCLTLSIDCRVCNKRRIRCDRRLPTCGKCDKRGLLCSGYGVILKWNQGIASRGNLRGREAPIHSPRSRSTNSTTDIVTNSTTSLLSVNLFHNSSILIQNSPLNSAPLPYVSNQLQNPEHRKLLHHYNQYVAPNMVWNDSSDNPWRQVIMPMALHSAPLLYSTLAFASKHLNAMRRSTSTDVNNKFTNPQSYHFQVQAMRLLAIEIENFMLTQKYAEESLSNQQSPATSVNEILATMLVLTNVETVWPGQ